MKNTKMIVLIAGLLSMTSALAHTSDYYKQHKPHYYTIQDRVDIRQQKQQRRIEQGIDSGLLTRGELEKLERQQNKIARLENRFKSDGRLSRKEQRILTQKLDLASQRINDLKNNGRSIPLSYPNRADHRYFD
ncbi:MAG: hypothetical protein ACXWTH_13635 [Methylosarcina sp.]